MSDTNSHGIIEKSQEKSTLLTISYLLGNIVIILPGSNIWNQKKKHEFVKTSDGHLFKKGKHECFKNSSNFIVGVLEQQTFTCSKSTLETLENDVKYV